MYSYIRVSELYHSLLEIQQYFDIEFTLPADGILTPDDIKNVRMVDGIINRTMELHSKIAYFKETKFMKKKEIIVIKKPLPINENCHNFQPIVLLGFQFELANIRIMPCTLIRTNHYKDIDGKGMYDYQAKDGSIRIDATLRIKT